MATVNIYLTFDGNCKEAFEFYRSVLGGEFPYIGTFADMPPTEGSPPMPDDLKNKIMHISLPISKETMIMGSDIGGEWTVEHKPGNNFSISLNTESKAEADKFFNGLSEGGEVTMPIDSTFWGDYFGMLRDKYGISWMVGFNENHQK